MSKDSTSVSFRVDDSRDYPKFVGIFLVIVDLVLSPYLCSSGGLTSSCMPRAAESHPVRRGTILRCILTSNLALEIVLLLSSFCLPVSELRGQLSNHKPAFQVERPKKTPVAASTLHPAMDHKKSFVKDEELSATSREDAPVIKSREDGGTTTLLMTSAADRALVWKFDLRILPVLAIMYLFNSLDKSNLGNAKTAGLEKTLKLRGHQYNTILSVFFIPYVLTAPFLGILGKKLGPNRVLPAMMFSFGCFTVLVTAVMNFGGLMTIRWFLGMSESAFFPLVIYYLTT